MSDLITDWSYVISDIYALMYSYYILLNKLNLNFRTYCSRTYWISLRSRYMLEIFYFYQFLSSIIYFFSWSEIIRNYLAITPEVSRVHHREVSYYCIRCFHAAFLKTKLTLFLTFVVLVYILFRYCVISGWLCQVPLY